jgi:nucleotide-binding universal stress UspA family protein
MFSKILVGVDGQSGGRDAIALAGQLVAEQGRLVLAHVHPGGKRFAKSPCDPDFEIGQHSESIALLERERNSTVCDAETITIGSPSVSGGLRRVAEELRADLLVVGSTSHHRLDRILGDHARADPSDTPCAVGIAPVGYASRVRPLYVVGVAYDGSPESEHALDAARELVRHRHASVRAIYVVDRPSLAPTPSETDDKLRSVLGVAQRQLNALAGVDGDAVYGQVAPTLAEWSTSLDLLVVGSRGHGPARRLIYGSKSRYLAQHAHCSLLVLAGGDREDDPPSGQRVGLESSIRAASDRAEALT